MSKVITRFAPSPTGYLHLGNYRTALFSYILAKKNSGNFLLRIEDTDKERSKKEYEENILASLDWLKLDYGSVIEHQSSRTEIYKKYLKKLIDEGKAYFSKEEVKEAGDRDEVIRFKNPNVSVSFHDEIRGEITMDTTDLGDFVIAKSIDEPTFHLAVVVDDFEMGVTHIVRGEDHISNTPRHILIQKAIGAPIPHYAHLPLVLSPDRTKLSKRKGAKALTYYRDEGFLPEAIINFLALLGWNPGTDQEIFSLDELIQKFDISQIQKSGAIFNEEKLRWFNKEYIKKLPKEELYARVQESIGKEITGNLLEKATQVMVERVQTFGELRNLAKAGEFDFMFNAPEYDANNLLWKGKGDLSSTKEKLSKVIELISNIPENKFDAETIKSAIWDWASEVGRGEVLWPMRFALSGKEKSPDPFIIAGIIGKSETLSRIQTAIKKCE